MRSREKERVVRLKGRRSKQSRAPKKYYYFVPIIKGKINIHDEIHNLPIEAITWPPWFIPMSSDGVSRFPAPFPFSRDIMIESRHDR